MELYKKGLAGENHFASLLNAKGIPYEFTDTHFDYTVAKNVKVEVKSCHLTVSNGHRQMGRYDFTDPENRKLQCEDDVWVCFIVQHHEQFMVQGFIKARKLKQVRYVSIIAASEHRLITFDEWVKEVI